MTTRLNKSMRDSIARAIVRNAYGKQATAMAAEMSHLTDLVFDDQLGKNAALFHAVPPTWFDYADGLRVNVGGANHLLKWRGFYIVDTLSAYIERETIPSRGRNIPHSIKSERHNYDIRSPLGEQIDGHFSRRETLESTVTNAFDTAIRTLSRFSTVETAIKEWPEAEKFLTPYKQTPTVRLPAVISADINRMLHLPPEDDGNETDLHK